MTAQERKLVDEGFESVAGAAKYLAIGRTRMYELIAGRVITHARLGGRLVVSRAALREYAASNLRPGSVA